MYCNFECMGILQVLQICMYGDFSCIAIFRVWQGEFMAGGSSLELHVFLETFC